MRGAFIVRLDLDANPSDGVFVGWVEEVDSGKEIKFHSSQELLRFLSGRSQALGSAERTEDSDEAERP
jgi:hypothetical protein